MSKGRNRHIPDDEALTSLVHIQIGLYWSIFVLAFTYFLFGLFWEDFTHTSHRKWLGVSTLGLVLWSVIRYRCPSCNFSLSLRRVYRGVGCPKCGAQSKEPELKSRAKDLVEPIEFPKDVKAAASATKQERSYAAEARLRGMREL